MGLIPDEIISEIRDRLDIVAIIGEHVQLKKAGASHKGLCPFHHEKSPSFHVSAAKRAYYCFGCQKKGDVFGFLMEMQGKGFVEVAGELAKRAGVTIPERPQTPEERARRDEKSRLLDVNALAAQFYRALLADEAAGAKGRAYLASRGIGDEIAETFQLGLAPAAWDGLGQHLQTKKVPDGLALTLGLVAPRQRGKGNYDKFRDRLMCPIILPAGEIVGFSGRDLSGESEAKYMNSPESPVYKKSHLLFGLHAARAAFHKKGRAVLVEGNFDVIALHQAGFSETVAPLGTALTTEQVEVLRRLAPGVTLCLDGDRAGRSATLKAIPLFLAAGIEAKVAALPDGEDPDSFVRKQGVPALEALLAGARPAVEYFVDRVWFESDRTAESQARAIRAAAALLANVTDDVKRMIIIDRFAKSLALPPNVVLRGILGANVAPAAAEPGPVRVAAGTPPPKIELQVLAILADHPELGAVAEILNVRSLLTDARLRDMYSAAQAGVPMVDAAPPELGDLVIREIFAESYKSLLEPRQTLEGAVRVLRREGRKRDLSVITEQLKDAQRRGDDDLATQLMVRQHELLRMAEGPEEDPR